MAETPTMEVRARLTAETAQFTKGMQQATQSMSSFTQQSAALRGAVLSVGIAAGAATATIVGLGIKSFMSAARVDELDVSMNAVGKSTGMGYKAIYEAAIATKDMGIEMEIAQQSAIKFAQNNLKLSYASELARAAQDLAVVSGKNSTETFNMLTHAVITGRSEVLKSVGIQKSAGQMYESFAKSIGKSANQLTYQEKQTAVATGALKEAAKVAGTYEAAMDSPGKVLRSFKRQQNEIEVALGGVLLKGFGPLIKSLYDVVKNISKALTKSEGFKTVLGALQLVIVKLTAPIVVFLDKMTDLIKKFTEAEPKITKVGEGITKVESPIVSLAEKFEMILPVLAAVGSGFAVLAGRQLFGMLPVVGGLLSKLSPLPVAMLVLALTSTQVRNAFLNLLSALKPILPVFTAIGKVMATISVIGVAVLAKAIHGLAAAVRGSINFVKTYSQVFKILLGVIGLLVIMYGAYRAQVFILNAITAISTALTTAHATATGFLAVQQAKLNMIMAMNPVGVYIALLVGLITVFGYLMATNEQFASVVGKVFNFVMKITIKVLAFIVKAIGNVLVSLSSYIKVLGFVAEVVAKVFEFIMDIVLTYYQFQLVVIQSIINAFINLMESQGLLYDVVKTIFNGIIKIISLVVEGIIRVLAFIVGTIADLVGAFNDLFGGVKKVFLSILDVISNVAGGIFNVLENVASNIGEFLGFVYDKMTLFIRKLADLIEKLPKIGPEIAAGIRSGLDAGRSLVTGFATTLVGFGKKAFDGIVTGVENTVNKIGGIGAGVEKGLRATEKILTNFAVKVEEFGGKDNGAKILEVMVSGAKLASGALDMMINAIQEVKDFDFARTVGGFIDGIAGKTEQAGQFLIGLSATMMDFAENTDFAAAVGEGIGNFINKIKDSLKEGLGFGDILKEEEKKYSEASKMGDNGEQAAEDALKAADRMKSIREAMQAGIDSIKGVLDDLRKASGEFADSLKDTIMGFAGLKSIELPDGFIPKAKSLIENMRQRLDKSNQFAQQIATLQAMGLDSGALKDIIESGPVKGAQLAASILGGGAEAISQINSLQKAISFSGAAIGQFGADAAFGGLIGNAQAQLNRLTEAELATRTSGNNQFIQQGAFQVVVNTSGAKTTEEEIKMITDKIEQTFAILAKELAAK